MLSGLGNTGKFITGRQMKLKNKECKLIQVVRGIKNFILSQTRIYIGVSLYKLSIIQFVKKYEQGSIYVQTRLTCFNVNCLEIIVRCIVLFFTVKNGSFDSLYFMLNLFIKIG